MNSYLVPKKFKLFVANLRNSGAITSDLRLDIAHFELWGTSNNLATSPNLRFSSLAALDEMSNSVAMTHFITPCYERKSLEFDSCEVFRGSLQYASLRLIQSFPLANR